ncbi:HPr family phosphocarrier protein [Streptomyces sp. NPDC127098]|uniref:HPr family phosphocarrier protein n=1 Tax=Streptomyces sp. NPDC127098 TaxID=3347137 RepID=UPI00365B7E01
MSARSETTVILPANLHARPAGQLTKAAAGFQSTVELDYAGRTVNAASVLGVMGLGATAGASVTVRATGEDADEAAKAIAEILATAE